MASRSSSRARASGDSIRIEGARQNNLRNLSLTLPLRKLIVVTGVSGSGKSSLAFDTLYSEGQRRYVETFSSYTRQFLDRMDKPRVDRIEGIPPAIAIDQTNPVRTSRSTVGTTIGKGVPLVRVSGLKDEGSAHLGMVTLLLLIADAQG